MVLWGRFLPRATVSQTTMVKAFIMVKTAAGKSEELVATIQDITGVDEAHIVAGQYDIIVEASSEEVYDLMHSVATELRAIDGVADTKTYICLA
jgi:DNA-binding Lrp family transcriptional regulator